MTAEGEWRGSVAAGFEPVVARLKDYVGAGIMSLGAQLAVSVDGQVLVDVAVGDDGLGRGVTQNTLFALYCTGKPLTTVALGTLVSDGQLVTEARVSDHLVGVTPEIGQLRLTDLLTHTAGLHHQTAHVAVFMPPAVREVAVLQSEPVAGWQIGVDGGYSEFGAWHILGRVIEAVTGSQARTAIASVMDGLGLTGDLWLGFTDAEYDAELDRLGVNLDMHALKRTPLLMERTRRVCTDANTALGSYGNARGLARLYSTLLDVLRGDRPGTGLSQETLSEFIRPQRPSTFDPILGRDCTFGLGFMVELRQHFFGTRCSPTAFGHSGFGGLSCGFADPEPGLAVGLLFNGHIDSETSLVYRRQSIVDSIYAALDQ